MSPNAREPVDPASRPLPAAATIAVAGLSAALVIAAGVLIAERVAPRRSSVPLAATPLPSMAPPAEESGRAAAAPVAPIVSAATIASAAPVVTAAPIVAAATIASAAPVAASGGDPAGLPADRGYLVLGGVAGARAFVNGANAGAAEERIAVPCGARYVRLGTLAEPGKPPTWVTAGRSVVVACRGETRIDLTP